VFPSHPNDNKYHLQAFRHFYVLAIQPNLFHSIDIDKKESVNVNFMIEKVKDSGEFSKKENVTPIMLQGADKWHRAKILDEDYHNLDFCFDKGTLGVIPRLLYIKKKFSDDINIGELRLC
jgi:anaphase-promoting complex subunit 1